MSGIKLGKDLDAPASSGLPDGRKLGPGIAPAPRPVRLANEGMGSTEKDRKIAATASDLLAANEKLKPKPVYVVAAVVAALILPIALTFAPNQGDLDFNPQDVAQEYAEFMRKAGTGQPPEKVRTILEDLHRLEDSGHKSEARLLCVSLLLSTDNTQANPVRKLASGHLHALK